MVRDNAAPVPCGVAGAASYFFESEDSAMGASSVALVVALQAFESLLHLGQSQAICPVPPQNRQSLLSIRRWRSSAVSLPSFPSLPCSSGLRDAGTAEVFR